MHRLNGAALRQYAGPNPVHRRDGCRHRETRLDIDDLGGHGVVEGERWTGRLHPLCFHCRAHGGERAAEELR
jgi:hypothetical protein